jgi:hypothetical protein
MPAPESFLDNLENLRLVMSVALEHVQDNRDPFVQGATGVQVRQVERTIGRLRVLTMQLEKEFAILEYLIGDGHIGAATFPTQNQNHA